MKGSHSRASAGSGGQKKRRAASPGGKGGMNRALLIGWIFLGIISSSLSRP